MILTVDIGNSNICFAIHAEDTPEPVFFERIHTNHNKTALEYMGLPAEQTIYVDDLTMSLDKAQTYGIHGVCSIADDPSRIVTNYPCVRHPGEVLDLLKEMNGGVL